MNLVTIRQFANHCGCSYEAIRQRVENGSIETVTDNPTTIDLDKYAETAQLIRMRSKYLRKDK